jgi:hypothetical protein
MIIPVLVLCSAIMSVSSGSDALPIHQRRDQADFVHGVCTAHAALTLNMTSNEIFFFSWAQDAASQNIAYSYQSVAQPYGQLAWSKNGRDGSNPVVVYQGLLPQQMKATYTEKGRKKGKDFVRFELGEDTWDSSDRNHGCNVDDPLSQWTSYTDPALNGLQTRSIQCDFSC